MFWIVFGAVVGIVVTYAWGALRGAPWVPTRHRDILRAVTIARPVGGERMVDVGCGTGGVLAAFARAGCRVGGWELAALPFFVARLRLAKVRAQIRYGDFWNANLSHADIVYAFLLPEWMGKLATKAQRELRHGARVITYVWPLPGWEPAHVDLQEGAPPLYLYIVNGSPKTHQSMDVADTSRPANTWWRVYD